MKPPPTSPLRPRPEARIHFRLAVKFPSCNERSEALLQGYPLPHVALLRASFPLLFPIPPEFPIPVRALGVNTLAGFVFHTGRSVFTRGNNYAESRRVRLRASVCFKGLQNTREGGLLALRQSRNPLLTGFFFSGPRSALFLPPASFFIYFNDSERSEVDCRDEARVEERSSPICTQPPSLYSHSSTHRIYASTFAFGETSLPAVTLRCIFGTFSASRLFCSPSTDRSRRTMEQNNDTRRATQTAHKRRRKRYAMGRKITRRTAQNSVSRRTFRDHCATWSLQASLGCWAEFESGQASRNRRSRRIRLRLPA